MKTWTYTIPTEEEAERLKDNALRRNNHAQKKVHSASVHYDEVLNKYILTIITL